jgi:hypothetical protein
MTKKEAEPIIRSLCHTWREERGLPLPPSDHHYSFSDFTSWLDSRGYSYCMNFRSTGGSQYAVEMWFDQEMKQTWRN